MTTDTPITRAARRMAQIESGTDCFDQLDEGEQERLRDVVRGVLEAVRKPSEAMCLAGADKTVSFAQHGIVHVSTGPSEPKVGAGQMFEAMIDAALAEG